MAITQTEFDAILADETKRITGDIAWKEDPDHAPAFEFRMPIESDAGYPLVLTGWRNPVADKLSFTIIHRSTGRVYGLDLGADHHNPTCENVGEKHKHRWNDAYADKHAYVPSDITAKPDEVEKAWREFCAEAKIIHDGKMKPVPPLQEDML
ncbi:MAG: hypothetical protein EOM20_07875 [Spartobacteria bacterium]|nr:hypothetical protein [Spartobacteria bacterium]